MEMQCFASMWIDNDMTMTQRRCGVHGQHANQNVHWAAMLIDCSGVGGMMAWIARVRARYYLLLVSMRCIIQSYHGARMCHDVVECCCTSQAHEAKDHINGEKEELVRSDGGRERIERLLWRRRWMFCEDDYAAISVIVVCVSIPFYSYVDYSTLSYVENSCFIQFHPIAPHKSVTRVAVAGCLLVAPMLIPFGFHWCLP